MKRRALVISVLLGVVLIPLVYFFWANQNSKDMTVRQKLLKTFYPAFMWATKIVGVNARFLLHDPVAAPVPFHSLEVLQIDGQPFDWKSLRGKKVLLVNTASDCGYTAQYAALQELSERYADRLVVLGFPSNDFKEQEKAANNSIHQFCQLNYGVQFPLMQKTAVLPGAQQHAVYQWLTQASQNGWNNKVPSWNFSKYLVDEEGRLILYADPSVSPMDSRLQQLIAN